MQEITENIIVSTRFRRITVGAILTKTGIICIDVPPYPEDARAWRNMLQERYRKPIRLIVITDAHRDRLLGLYWFHDAQLVGHDATYDAMRALPSTFVEQAAEELATSSEERASFTGVRLRLPITTFNYRMTAYVGDYGLPLMAMPGPTPGNVWVHLPEKGVVFTGDSVVLNQHPYMARAQSKQWLNSLTVLRRPRFTADVIVAGRGMVYDKNETQELSEFLRYVRRRVQRLYRARRPRADMVNMVPSLLNQFPIPLAQQEDVFRRVRLGLESIYDEFMRDEPLPELPEPEVEDENGESWSED